MIWRLNWYLFNALLHLGANCLVLLVYVCVCMYVTCVCIGTTGWHQVSSVALHIIFWDMVSYWIWSFTFRLNHPASTRDPKLFTSQFWDCSLHAATHEFLCGYWSLCLYNKPFSLWIIPWTLYQVFCVF